jgi:hypothetical protein
MNLSAWIMEARDSADYSLLVMVRNEDGTPGATIASISVDDPNIGPRLRDISQAFRMGARFGKESNA